MQTWGTRANAIFAHLTFVTGVLLILNWLSSYLFNPTLNVTLDCKIENFRNVRFGYEANQENDQANISFTLDADLSPLFNWNTKQVFVYIWAEYKTEKNVLNQFVIWDKIILTKEDAVLKLKNELNEYLLTDQGNGLRKNQLNVTLSWDVTPITGLLRAGSKGSVIKTLPAQYTR